MADQGTAKTVTAGPAAYSGERYDPEKANALAHADHHTRYHFVRRSFSGGRLLDVGCGLGIGAQFLSGAFTETHGIDASEASVALAQRLRGTERLTFSSVDEFVSRGGGQFDVVTCLEVIEHTAAQRELVELLRASSTPGGVVIVSTPNREWTQRKGLHNPFHVKELLAEEFFGLLDSSFPHVQRWSQVQTQGGAVTQSGTPQPMATAFSGPTTIDAPYHPADVTNFVAVCSLQPRPVAQPVSVLDAACTFQLELEAIIKRNEQMIDERDALLRQQDALVATLRADVNVLVKEREALAEQVRRLRRLEEPPDADVVPLRWRVADRVNQALKETPVHSALKKLLSRE